MRWVLFTLMLLHGLIHFTGFAKSFGLAELPQLTQPISKGFGMAWLVAGLLLLGAAMLFLWAPRVWWMAGLGGVLLSQVVIISSWRDAKFGSLANALILGIVGVVVQPSRRIGEFRVGRSVGGLPRRRSFQSRRWSTPVRDYRNFGPRRVSTRGEGRWTPPEGEFTYLEMELLDLQTNGGL